VSEQAAAIFAATIAVPRRRLVGIKVRQHYAPCRDQRRAGIISQERMSSCDVGHGAGPFKAGKEAETVSV
jgi:hypothetical protein